MLRSPKRLPQRFNRPVTRSTRRLVERRLTRKRQFLWQRWQRVFQRLQRRAGNMRRLVVQFASLIVGGFLLLMVGLILFSPLLHIREIRISRSDPRIDAETIQQSLAPLFGSHLFFVSAQDIMDLVDDAVPDLREAHITKQYPSTLQLRITLDPIIAQLTIDEPASQGATATGALAGTGAARQAGGDYLTANGIYVVYAPSQVQTGSGLLRLTIVDWGVRPEPWKQLMEPQFLDVIRAAETELRSQFGMDVRARTAYLRAREFHLKTSRHTLWFDLRSPLPEQLERYRIFLQSAGPDAAKQYIDLRLKDKIVYK